MSSTEPELGQLLAPMRDGPIALSGAAEANARRERLLPALRAEAARTPGRLRRARQLRRATLAGGAALSALAIAVGALHVRGLRESRAGMEPLRVEPLGAEAVTWIDATGARTALPEAAEITAPGELVAPSTSGSRVSTARGVRIELAPRTRLRVTTGAGKARRRSGLRLEQGEVRCKVPPLGEREHFAIATPDAQVVVHGTAFSVRFGDPALAGTCVRVTEGLVEVRHRGGRVRLGPGASWGCERTETVAKPRELARKASEAGPAMHERAAEASARRPARRAKPRPAQPVGQSAMPLLSGTLAEENALLGAALAAERANERARAHALYSALLERHPGSPLAPEARQGLARTR